jgi:cytochrome P450
VSVERQPIADWVTLEELDRDPHPILHRLRAESPVVWVPALGMWVVTRRDDVLAAMRDDEGLTVDDPRFSTGRITGPSMLSTDGAEHARHRAPFARPFRLAAVHERFDSAVGTVVDDLIDRIEADGDAELRTALAGPLAARTMLLALGFDTADERQVLDWYRDIVEGVTRITAGEDDPASAHAAYAALAAALLAATERDPGSSLLAAAAHDATGLDRDSVAANAAILLFGGIETTEGMIANLLHHLLSNPAALDAVRADSTLIDGAIEESLRLEPAAAVVDRYATRPVELAGVEIPAGDPVTLSMAAANRDPVTFHDPDRFDPARENARLHTTFATGPHVCLGMHLARLEARIALERLFARLPRLRADPERPSAPRGLVFRKPPDIWAVWG